MRLSNDANIGWSRRRLMAGLSVAAAQAGHARAEAGTLRAAAAKAGLRFGTAVRLDALDASPDLAGLVLRECDTLTPELVLKWRALEPADGVLDFGAMDRFADFARRNGKRVRGHTLLWRKSIPEWAEGALKTNRDWRLVSRFFASVMPRYGDVVDEWDVVNEPIDIGSRPDGLGESPLLAAFGPDYVRRALEQARVFAPRARLMINEFDLETDRDEARRTALLRLVEGLKARGAPLDGVGLQGHLRIGRGRLAQGAFAAFLRTLAGFGLTLAVTELDVREWDYIAPVEERDRRVAAEARAFLDVALAEPAVKSLSTWGLTDRGSWLDVTKDDLARFPGAWADGSSPGLNRGLPYDAALHPKALRDVLLAAMARRVQPSFG